MTVQRRCILHVGTMKTGTTSVQSWLRDNNDWLNQNGWDFLGWPLRGADKIAAKVAAADPAHNLIISDEGLWHLSGSERSKTQKIASTLQDYDISVIVYFRRPDLFLESWFKQGLKNGAGQHNVSTFLKLSETSEKTLSKKLDAFAGIFGEDKLIVAPYERCQMKDGDIIADFVMRTGIPMPAKVETKAGATGGVKNVSPTSDAMLMAGLMRQLFDVQQEQIEHVIRAKPAQVVADARSSIFTAEEAEQIRSVFRPVFQRIQSRFGTGVEPDFFENWGDQEPHPPVSALRAAYDSYMAELKLGKA